MEWRPASARDGMRMEDIDTARCACWGRERTVRDSEGVWAAYLQRVVELTLVER